MKDLWIVPERTRRILGPFTVEQLPLPDPASAFTCQLCGKVKSAGVTRPMVILAAAADDGTPIVAFAHPECAAHASDPDSVLRRRAAAGGTDAQAVFGERAGVWPHGVLIFEGSAALSVMNGSGPTNWLVKTYLESGFELARVEPVDLAPPLATGWVLATGGGMIDLGHPELPAAYVQPISESHTDWLALVRREQRVLVVTGTGLGLSPGVPVDLRWAVGRGTLVAATVKVR